MSKAYYFNRIITTVNEVLKPIQGKKRALLIFFKTFEILMEFKNWSGFEHYSRASLVLDESMKKHERASVISRATYGGQITLATRKFGRGTDFICMDEEVEEIGGVHVI